MDKNQTFHQTSKRLFHNQECLLQCFHSAFQTCISCQAQQGNWYHSSRASRLCFKDFCDLLRIFLNHVTCSCYAPLKTLIICIFNVLNCSLTLNEFWDFNVRVAVQQSVFHKMDVKRCHSLKSPIASSLIKILNSFLKCQILQIH